MPASVVLSILLLGPVWAAPADEDPADRARRRYEDVRRRIEASMARVRHYLDRFPELQACYAAAPDPASLDACREPEHAAVEREVDDLPNSLSADHSHAKMLWMSAQYTAIAKTGAPDVSPGLAAMRDDEAFGRRFEAFKAKECVQVKSDDAYYSQAAARFRNDAQRGRLLRRGAAAALAAGLAAFWVWRRKLRSPGPGDMVGADYRVERRLDRKGLVLEATDVSLKRRVILRRVHQRQLDAAHAAAALKHPNIVEIYAVLLEKGKAYLVFEHVEGRTLAEHLAGRGVLSPAQTQSVVRQVGAALAYAHERKTFHGDLRPERILVRADGSVKLMGFGLAAHKRGTKASDLQALDACAREMLGEALDKPA